MRAAYKTRILKYKKKILNTLDIKLGLKNTHTDNY